jgi:4-aminobutyrate aminotransferase-like enzyme
MPLAAVVTTRAIAQSFAGQKVEYFNTFGGNPVCAAAGLAVLEVSANQVISCNQSPSRRVCWSLNIRILQSNRLVYHIPMGMALQVIEQEGLQEHAREVGRYLRSRLAELREKHALIGDVRGMAPTH